VGEKHPQHNQKSLISSLKQTINFVNTMPNGFQTPSPHTALHCHIRRDTGKSDRVEGHKSLHTASGPTCYLCSATGIRDVKSSGTLRLVAKF